jgi:surface polysaccharide O-acyltransferase-like enzyme
MSSESPTSNQPADWGVLISASGETDAVEPVTVEANPGQGSEAGIAGHGPSRSLALDVVRICAILGVVAIHSFGYIVTNVAIEGSVDWWFATAIDYGSRWVVPVFVMVSGALLLSPRAHAEGPAAFYRKRLFRLGPAFVVWQLFYVFIVRIWLTHEALSRGAILQLFANGTTYEQLYFLWLIVGLYLVAPVLAAFLREGGPTRAYIFAAAVLVFTLAVYALTNLSALNGDPQPIVLNALTEWLPYVGYFLAGWALRNAVLRSLWTILVGVITAGLLVETVWQYVNRGHLTLLQAVSPVSYLGAIVAISSIGIFLVGQGIFASVKPSRRTSRVVVETSAASFGVFLVHAFLIVAALTLIPWIGSHIDSNILVALGVWLGAVVVSFAISIGARRVPVLRLFF